MRVAQLAEKMGVTADTVRYYTRLGILQPAKNKTNGYKEYDEQDEKKLHFVLCARRLGFTVIDIQQIINHASRGKSPCLLVRNLFETRLAEIAATLAETQRLYKRMLSAVDRWKSMPDNEPTETTICSLIENWDTPKGKTNYSR